MFLKTNRIVRKFNLNNLTRNNVVNITLVSWLVTLHKKISTRNWTDMSRWIGRPAERHKPIKYPNYLLYSTIMLVRTYDLHC